MHEVIMPKLGLTMESGIIEKWHKKEGDTVKEGDVLFEVMTDKVSLEVESYNSGILKKILRGEGEEVPVTEAVAYIGEEDEIFEEEKAEGEIEVTEKAINEQSRQAEEESEAGKGFETAGPEDQQDRKIRISPLARKLARERGIDISKLKGSGPRGRIIKKDILEAGDKKDQLLSSQAAVKRSSPLEGIRKTIARKMSQSYSGIPHISLSSRADATSLVSMRERLKGKWVSAYGIKATYTDFIIKIAAYALKDSPDINSSYMDGNHIVYQDINIGMAVDVEKGLVVPTIYQVDKLTLLDIARKRAELTDKARQGKLSVDEVSNGTFTISNLGMHKAVRSFTAIINPPQAAIMAVGAIYRQPGIFQGKIEPRSYMEITLSADHRIIDGAAAARFLEKVSELIENPELLFI